MSRCYTLRCSELTFHSHCNTCKELSGSTFTLNQIIPAKALKITKGDDLGKYTYKGDSGKGVHCVCHSTFLSLSTPHHQIRGILIAICLVLLQELHLPRVPYVTSIYETHVRPILTSYTNVKTSKKLLAPITLF